MPPSTAHAVLVRCRINRLPHVDRATGEPIRRYVHEKPGDLLHMNVKKLGRVPDGGGRRYVARQRGGRDRLAAVARTGAPESKCSKPLIGTCCLHTVVDDHSGLPTSRCRAGGRTTKEIRRCLKRYLARQLYRTLEALHSAPDIDPQSA